MELTDLDINAAVAAELRAEKAAKRPKLSVRVLAEKAGMTTVTTNRVLNGDRDINVTQLLQLGAALDVPPTDLFSRAITRLGGMPAVLASASERAEHASREQLSEASDTKVIKFPTPVEDMTVEQLEAQRHAATRDGEMDQPEQFD